MSGIEAATCQASKRKDRDQISPHSGPKSAGPGVWLTKAYIDGALGNRNNETFKSAGVESFRFGAWYRTRRHPVLPYGTWNKDRTPAEEPSSEGIRAPVKLTEESRLQPSMDFSANKSEHNTKDDAVGHGHRYCSTTCALDDLNVPTPTEEEQVDHREAAQPLDDSEIQDCAGFKLKRMQDKPVAVRLGKSKYAVARLKKRSARASTALEAAS